MVKKKTDLIKINHRPESVKIDINFLDWLKEVEFGIDKKFDFEYYHDHYMGQMHCLSLGHFYVAWRGAPYLDARNN